MRLLVFSSRLQNLQEKIRDLRTALHAKHDASCHVETYDTNSFEGMLKAVRLTVFSPLEAVLFDDHDRIIKRFTDIIPSAEELVCS